MERTYFEPRYESLSRRRMRKLFGKVCFYLGTACAIVALSILFISFLGTGSHGQALVPQDIHQFRDVSKILGAFLSWNLFSLAALFLGGISLLTGLKVAKYVIYASLSILFLDTIMFFLN